MYYNTTNETGDQLKMFSKKSKSQDEIVLSICSKMTEKISASSIYKEYPISNVPITSIRRSLNTLVNNGKICIKTNDRGHDKKVIGMYGRKEFEYELMYNSKN